MHTNYAEKTEEVETEGQEDLQNMEVVEALRIISNDFNGKKDKDSRNQSIRALFKEGFEISDPSGMKKIGSKVIQQCLWRTMSKVKFLDFQLHSSIRSENAERITSDGFRTVANRGGLESNFRDKGGVFWNSFMSGDGFLIMGQGKDGNSDIPIEFRTLENEDVYTDTFAKGIRGTRPAQKLAAIYSYEQDEAYNNWPVLEEYGTMGRIPGSYEVEDRKEKEEAEQVLEVCWFYNLTTQSHTVFAGAQGHIIDQFEGDEYPHMLNGAPFIPVFQFLCQPSEEGFRNYGIGDMVYDLAVITRKLLNLQIGHTEEGVYPLTLINAPQGKVDELVEKMAYAYKAREKGKRPIVAMEFDANGGQQSVATQSLLTQSLVNEWQILWETLYREIARLGIYLDDVDRGSGITRGQVIAEEEASNAFVKQMMEYNASETQFLVEAVLSGIVEYVSPNNKSQINMTARVQMDDGQMVKMNAPITLGMLATEVKEGKYFAVVNSRTGALPSDLWRITQLERQLATTPPGTPEFAEINRSMAMLRGIDMPMGAAQPPQAGAPPGESNQVTPQAAETQRSLPAMLGKQINPL